MNFDRSSLTREDGHLPHGASRLSAEQPLPGAIFLG